MKAQRGILKEETSPERHIGGFAKLGNYLLSQSADMNEAIHQASLHNKWFSKHDLHYALNAIAENYLDAEKLDKWIAQYDLAASRPRKRIGIVMAGNVPLAGFHDLLCVLATGNIAVIKLSSKDRVLLPYLLNKLCQLEPEFRYTFEFAEQLKDFDAVIATGSNNSARYFEHYFGKYPHIIRKNRNSVAVLTGKETKDDLLKLGDDIFLYFGLGCRSVSKLHVPKDYDFNSLLEALQPFQSSLIAHNGYKNNFDYNLTLHIMNKTPHFNSNFLLLQESKVLSSPIATLNFEYYRTLDEVKTVLRTMNDYLQCVVSNALTGAVPFGESQKPQLPDYADELDTMNFILSLR